MRKVCRLAADTLLEVGDKIRPGMTTLDIDRIVHEHTLSQGARPAPLHYKGFPKSVCTSVNEIVCHGIPDATVLLYGSVARGVAGPDSDWDLLVLTDGLPTPAQRQGISDALYGLELQHSLVISELVCSRDEWDASLSCVGPLHQNVERDGVLI